MDNNTEAPDTIPASQFVPDQPGQSESTPDTIPANQFVSDADKYGSLGQQAKTFGEHAASAATFGLSTKAETVLGVNPEDIRGRSEENPASGVAGTLTSLLIPGAPEAKLLGKAGELAAGAVRGSSVLSKIGAGAVKGAVENALFQAGDETSKAFTGDPNQSVQTAMTDMGLSGVLGGALGAGFGAVHPLWEGSKADKFTDEFKSRINEHLTNPDLATQTSDKLDDFYNDTTKGSDSLFKGNYDEAGVRTPSVKDQALEKLMPQESTELLDKSVGKVTNKLEDTVENMQQDTDTFQPRYTKMINKQTDQWKSVIDNSQSKPIDIFKATEDMKRNLDGEAAWDQHIDKTDPSYPAIQEIRKIASFLRQSLEDTSIWGEAGKFQQTTNKAYSEFLNPLKEFNKSFTGIVEGKNVIDPDKVNTYMNQIANERGVLRSQKLENYLKAADKYRDAINEAHEKIGIAGPFENRSADAVNTFTQKLAPGAKAADTLVKGLMNSSGSEGAGAVGGYLAGWPGYMLGKHVVGPVLDSVIPSLLKPVLGSATNGSGLKHALELMGAFSKGETSLNKGIKNLFTAGKETLPASMMSTSKDTEKLDKQLKSLAQNPEPLTDVGGSTAHYLPNHGVALAKTAATAVSYLNSQRPNPPQVSPLDTPSKPSTMEQNKFNRVLGVAQQPLTVLQHIKDGTLQPSDIKTLTNIYPELYQKISQGIINQISARKPDSDPIPYVTKMGMSLFLGKPMDSTMLPESIQAAQLPPKNLQQTPQGKQIKSPRSPSAKSAKSMETVNNSYRTPSQARAETKSQASE